MVVVTKKKINNKKAISAIDPALISGFSLLAIVYDLNNPFNKSQTKNKLAIDPKIILYQIPAPTQWLTEEPSSPPGSMPPAVLYTTLLSERK